MHQSVSSHASLAEQVACMNGWIECFCIATFDLELGQSLNSYFFLKSELFISIFSKEIETIYPQEYQQLFSKEQKADIAYLSFPDSNSKQVYHTTFCFRIRDYEIDANNKEKSFLFGYVYFSQQKSAVIQRGYSQRSLILISRYPFLSLFSDIISYLGELYFEQAQELQFHQIISQMNSWPMPHHDSMQQLELLGKIFVYRTPIFNASNILNRFLNRKSQILLSEQQQTKAKGFSISNEKIKAKLHGRRNLYQDDCVQVYSMFQNSIHLDNLTKYWELIILGEPLLVLSPSPDQCSQAVLSLISLISPIQYGGDFRPFYTVHNSEFKEFSKMGENVGLEPRILGITNPFFVKSFEKWPHLIAIGKKSDELEIHDKKSSVSTVPGLVGNLLKNPFGIHKTSAFEERQQLMWEFKEGFFSEKQSKNFVLKQTELQQLKKSFICLEDGNVHQSSANSVNSKSIQTHFEQLTENFLQPLHRCFDTLLCSAPDFIFRSNHAAIFKPEKFYKYVCKYGYNETIFQSMRASILEFYRKFIYSINFQMWIEQRIKEAYLNEVLHMDVKNFLKQKENTFQDFTALYMDIFLRLKHELEEESNGGGYFAGSNLELCNRLKLFLKIIAENSPTSELQTMLQHSIENL